MSDLGAHALAVSAAQIFKRACVLLLDRALMYEKRVQDGDETSWPKYLEALAALSKLVPHLQPGANGELITTKQMADRLGISVKTLLKKRGNGGPQPAETLGKRGRAAMRWKP